MAVGNVTNRVGLLGLRSNMATNDVHEEVHALAQAFRLVVQVSECFNSGGMREICIFAVIIASSPATMIFSIWGPISSVSSWVIRRARFPRSFLTIISSTAG